jgi:hypothetical protein
MIPASRIVAIIPTHAILQAREALVGPTCHGESLSVGVASCKEISSRMHVHTLAERV